MPHYDNPEVISFLGASTIRPGSAYNMDLQIEQPKEYLDPLLDELRSLTPEAQIPSRMRYARLARVWMPYLWGFVPTQHILQDQTLYMNFIGQLNLLQNRGDFVGPQNRPYPFVFPDRKDYYSGIRIALGKFGGLIVGAVGFKDLLLPHSSLNPSIYSTLPVTEHSPIERLGSND